MAFSSDKQHSPREQFTIEKRFIVGAVYLTFFLYNRVPFYRWNEMTDDQQNKVPTKFAQDRGKTRNHAVATNDNRYVLTTPKAGRKPNREKRKRAERSRATKAKKIFSSLEEHGKTVMK